MLDEAMEGLALRTSDQWPVAIGQCATRRGGVFVDVTFGGGGHSRAILDALGSEGHLYAFDQDEDAAECVNALMRECVSATQSFTFIHENFRYMKSFLRLHGVREVDGVLADLGVSSHQFDTADRGFSTRMDGELDMRMDRHSEVTARDLVNTMDEDDLARLLRMYGELPNARQMAKAIVQFRSRKSEVGGICTTGDLKEAVSRHLPRGMENKYLAMLFQALRIEVNGELEALKEMLTQACELLVPGGRLVVISYHSLEDRLVKNFMRSGNFEGVVEKDFYGNPLTPMCQVSKCTASEAEVAANNRARSAMLRVAEKLPVKS